MSRKLWVILCAILIGVAALTGVLGLERYYKHFPDSLRRHSVMLSAPSRLVPGSGTAMLVTVHDIRDYAPLSDVTVKVQLRPKGSWWPKTLFVGKTDLSGTVSVSFTVPSDIDKSSAALIIRSRSHFGADVVREPVVISRGFRVALITDKPLYQPGQIIHMRALALDHFDLRPVAGQSLRLCVSDGRGNTVFDQTLTTSEFGVASADFQLADETNFGTYQLAATLIAPSRPSAHETVNVEPYVLPKFDVALQTARAYYRPGARVEGVLTARYFFGEALAGGHVRLEGYTYADQRAVAVTLEGVTNDHGVFEFGFDLPEDFANGAAEASQVRFHLDAVVTDLVRHAEGTQISFLVTQDPLHIQAVWESGLPRPGVENIFYVMATYPDGAPAEDVSLTIFRENPPLTLTAQTGAYGLASVSMTPVENDHSLRIWAHDRSGAEVTRSFSYRMNDTAALLLRPDAPVYRAGDTMRLTVFTSAPTDTVYLAVARAGQVVSTHAMLVRNGQGEFLVDVTPDLYGVVELYAYSARVAHDMRLVLVERGNYLDIALIPGMETYKPGEAAVLDVRVNGVNGAGVRAALGLTIVDEAIFALAEQDLSFSSLYLTLEDVKPALRLKGFAISDMVNESLPVDDSDLPGVPQTVGQAVLASVGRSSEWLFDAFSDSVSDRRREAERERKLFYPRLSDVLFAVVAGITLVLVWLNLMPFRRVRHSKLGAAICLSGYALGYLLYELLPVVDDWTRGSHTCNKYSDWRYYGFWICDKIENLRLLLRSPIWDKLLDWRLFLLILAVSLGALVWLSVKRRHGSPLDVAWRSQDSSASVLRALLPVFLLGMALMSFFLMTFLASSSRSLSHLFLVFFGVIFLVGLRQALPPLIRAAVQEDDRTLKWNLLLQPLFLCAVVFLPQRVERWGVSPPIWMEWVSFVSLAILPLLWLLRAGVYILLKRVTLSKAASLMAVVILTVLCVPVTVDILDKIFVYTYLVPRMGQATEGADNRHYTD